MRVSWLTQFIEHLNEHRTSTLNLFNDRTILNNLSAYRFHRWHESARSVAIFRSRQLVERLGKIALLTSSSPDSWVFLGMHERRRPLIEVWGKLVRWGSSRGWRVWRLDGKRRDRRRDWELKPSEPKGRTGEQETTRVQDTESDGPDNTRSDDSRIGNKALTNSINMTTVVCWRGQVNCG